MNRTTNTRHPLTYRGPRAGWISALGSLALLLGLAGSAAAQTGVGGTTGTTTLGALTADDFVIRPESPPTVALHDFDLQRFFNIANCECNAMDQVSIFFTLSPSGFAKRATAGTGTVQLFVGYQCDNPAIRNCDAFSFSGDLTTFLSGGGVRIDTDARTLSTYHGQPLITTTDLDGGTVTADGGSTTTVNGCAIGIAFNQTVWMLIHFANSTNVVDVTVTKDLPIDLAPPPTPGNQKVQGGNEGLNVSWDTISTAEVPDLLGYQLLCDRAGSLQVFPNGTFSAGFQTCNLGVPPGLDANVLALDPNFVCSPLLPANTGSFRIKILQNNITYGVGLVAIDTHHNASFPQVDFGTPVPTVSFYEQYRNKDGFSEPGKAKGGFCALAPESGARPPGAAALAAIVVLAAPLLARRRRRRP